LRVLGRVRAAVAAQAGPRQTAVIHRHVGSRKAHARRGLGRCRMAGVALPGVRDMRRILPQCAREGERAVVTGQALPIRPGMVHHGGLERDEVVMTGVALQRRRNVVGRLGEPPAARRVAGRAPACVGGGVDMGRSPRRPTRPARVAAIALRRGHHVIGRLHLRVLGQVSSAVAGRTLTIQTRMVHGRRRESDEIQVAGVARPAVGDVGRVPRLSIGEGVRTVVAGRALSGRPNGMVHGGRLERGEILVASITLLAGRHVGAGLAETAAARRVAGRAPARRRGNQIGVVEVQHGRPARRARVAGVALSGRHNVGRRLGLRVLRDIRP